MEVRRAAAADPTVPWASGLEPGGLPAYRSRSVVARGLRSDRRMSIDEIHERVLALLSAEPRASDWRTYLDIGSGRGDLIARVTARFPMQASACDYTAALMERYGQAVDVANLNHEDLPYADASFDVVTATEVIEHLEDFRRIVREIHRVLKPGGVCVLSTPNVLNLNSRLRFLSFGFWNLFGPLPVRHGDLHTTGGHINPVSWFYVAHAMLDAGFERLEPHVDKLQRSALAAFVLLAAPIRLFGWRALRRERNRFGTIDAANEPIVRAMNSTPLLLGRTLVVLGRRP
jgi:SAM-dependent methyltransferase